MLAVTGEEMKKIDTYTCQNITPSIELMERAGKAMSDAILKHYGFQRVLILCGSSGNGGDGFVVGRYLMEANKQVDVFLISDKLSPDCEANRNRFLGTIYKELPKLDYDIIVDALIGFGLKSTLRQSYIDVIERVNASKKCVVSLDIPTGIDATNGKSYGAYIHSDFTFTIEYPKTGLYMNDGLDSWNHIEVLPIGIVPAEHFVHINEIEDFKGALKERTRNSHKGNYGKACILGGSYTYPGASLLAYNALDQFYMGVGYSYLYVPKCVYELYALRHPELIVSVLPDIDGHIAYSEASLEKLLSMDSIAIGMGMDVSIDLYKVLEYLLIHYKKTLIIDADAINTLAKYGVDILKKKSCKVILTPHIKEMERLSGIDKKEISEHGMEIAKSFAKEYDVTLILKSASSIITDGKELSLSIFGNSGLAKGGSGDTLSGILSGLAAALDSPYEVARLGAYILGRAAEFTCPRTTEYAMSPLDVANEIKTVIKEITHE